MKRVCSLLFLSFICLSSFAQGKRYFPKAEVLKVVPHRDDAINYIMPDAEYLYGNEIGNVYRLPLDNMLCLVPGMKTDMPVYGKLLPYELHVPPRSRRYIIPLKPGIIPLKGRNEK